MINKTHAIIRLAIQLSMLFFVILLLPEAPGSMDLDITNKYTENTTVNGNATSSDASNEKVVSRKSHVTEKTESTRTNEQRHIQKQNIGSNFI